MLIEKDYKTQSVSVCKNLTSVESIQLNSFFTSVKHNSTLTSAVNITLQLSSDLSEKLYISTGFKTLDFKKKRKN